MNTVILGCIVDWSTILLKELMSYLLPQGKRTPTPPTLLCFVYQYNLHNFYLPLLSSLFPQPHQCHIQHSHRLQITYSHLHNLRHNRTKMDDTTKKQPSEGNQLQGDDGSGGVSDNAGNNQGISLLLLYLFLSSSYLIRFFTLFLFLFLLPSPSPFSLILLPLPYFQAH